MRREQIKKIVKVSCLQMFMSILRVNMVSSFLFLFCLSVCTLTNRRKCMGCYTLSPLTPNSHWNWVVNLIGLLPFVECRAVEDAEDLVDLEGDDGSQHDVKQTL